MVRHTRARSAAIEATLTLLAGSLEAFHLHGASAGRWVEASA